MGRRKKNKKKFNKEVIAVVFTAITIILIISYSLNKNRQNPASKGTMDVGLIVVSWVENAKDTVQGSVKGMFSYKENMKRIAELEEENKILKEELIKSSITKEQLDSLEQLKNAVNYVDESYGHTYVSASIVGKNDGNFYTSFTIGAGIKDGVQKDSIILSSKGLVGVVYEVSDNYSKGISILNYKSSVSFQTLRNEEYSGILNQDPIRDGNDNLDGILKGYLFDLKYDVVPGDIIITSGLGMYPKGIPVGEVESVEEDKNNLLKYIKVNPYSNFKDLDNVMIIPPRITE